MIYINLYDYFDPRILDMRAKNVPVRRDDGVIELLTIGAGEKYLYGLLKLLIEEMGEMIPMKELADTTGEPRNKVAKSLRRLEKAGLIEMKKIPGKPYRFKVKTLEESRIIYTPNLIVE